MNTNRSTFTSSVKTWLTSSGLAIGFNTTHGVVNYWANRYRSLSWVYTGISLCKFADEWKTFMEVVFTEVTEVEVNCIAKRHLDSSTLLLFVPESLRYTVTWTKFHVLVLWVANWSFRAQTVILEVTVAVLVYKDPAFTTTTFGHKKTTA